MFVLFLSPPPDASRLPGPWQKSEGTDTQGKKILSLNAVFHILIEHIKGPRMTPAWHYILHKRSERNNTCFFFFSFPVTFRLTSRRRRRRLVALSVVSSTSGAWWTSCSPWERRRDPTPTPKCFNAQDPHPWLLTQFNVLLLYRINIWMCCVSHWNHAAICSFFTYRDMFVLFKASLFLICRAHFNTRSFVTFCNLRFLFS